MLLMGRKKIYTDEKVITSKNLNKVLNEAFIEHNFNREEIKFLLEFEKGKQPLKRKKTTRPEINIESIANMANEISEFKLGYFWGNPISNVPKCAKDGKTEAIAKLNRFFDLERKDSKDQELARYIEICGIGYQMIDMNREFDGNDYTSPFNLITLNPLCTFMVYDKTVNQNPIMAVTYSERKDLSKIFTCITKDAVYYVDSKNNNYNYEKLKLKSRERSGEANPFEEIYIIEFERSYDRTGCFERQIKELDALNILESDLTNDVAQNTQAIWWGNDIKLEEDDSGNIKGVQGGQWILSQTNGQGQKPSIQPLTLQYEYNGVLSYIQAKHDYILERAFVPKQSDPGGGSTTGAMSLSSGWSACESVACKQALVVKKSFQDRNRLALKVAHKRMQDADLKELKESDIDIRFIRQKTFDMASKVNALATMINNFVDPKVAMTSIDFFPNLAEAIDDSYENMKKYQEKLLENNTDETVENNTDETLQDMSDQNSPLSDL